MLSPSTSGLRKAGRSLLPGAVVLAVSSVLVHSTPGATLRIRETLSISAIATVIAALLSVRFRYMRSFLFAVSVGALQVFLVLAPMISARPPAALHLWGGLMVAADVLLLFVVAENIFDWRGIAWWMAFLCARLGILLLAAWLGWSALQTQPGIQLPLAGHLYICSLTFLAGAVVWLIATSIQADAISASLFSAATALALAFEQPHLAGALLMIAAASVALAVGVVERSYWISYHDELTGLASRRAFNQFIETLDGDYAIAIVDVDHFKRFNDVFGHDIGDQVLRKVACRLDEVGGGGKAYRCGGEEFAVIFPKRNAKDSVVHAEALRMAIEQDVFIVRGMDRSTRKREERRSANPRRGRAVEPRPTTVTVSIGIAQPGPRTPSVHEVIEAADKALYRAKEGGRNRVELAPLPAKIMRGSSLREEAISPRIPPSPAR